jgi:hypothetical protein
MSTACNSGRCTSGRQPRARGWRTRTGRKRQRPMRRGCTLCVMWCFINYGRHILRKGVRTCKNVAVSVVDVACDEGREECEEEVPEPVGSGRQCALLGTRPCWESLANQNPDTPVNVVSCLSHGRSDVRETYGAQVVAKPQMNMQAETIITAWSASKYMHSWKMLRIRTVTNSLVRRWVLGSSGCGKYKEPC